MGRIERGGDQWVYKNGKHVYTPEEHSYVMQTNEAQAKTREEKYFSPFEQALLEKLDNIYNY